MKLQASRRRSSIALVPDRALRSIFMVLISVSCLCLTTVISYQLAHSFSTPSFFSLLLPSISSTDLQIGLSSSNQKTCNPYKQYGSLNVNLTHPHQNRWMPFRNDCPAPAYMASFMREAAKISPPTLPEEYLGANGLDDELGPDGRPWEDISWARNRTIVFFADSVMRFNVRYFCEMMGEPLVRVNSNHSWMAPDMPQTREEIYWDGTYCHIPSMDLMIMWWMQFGMDESDFWSIKTGSLAPRGFEDRIDTFLKPFVRGAEIDGPYGPRGTPDLMYVQSTLWDLGRWARTDVANKASTTVGLGIERLKWFKSRVQDATVRLRTTFPDISLRWVASHYPVNGKSIGFFTDDGAPAEPVVQSLARLVELDAATRSALSERMEESEECNADCTSAKNDALATTGWNDWGRFLLGQEKNCFDAAHHNLLPGGYLWADLMFSDLKELIFSR